MDDTTQRDGANPGANRRCLLKRVVVIGSTGQLGSDLVLAYGQEEVTGLTHDDIEVTDAEAVRDTLHHLHPAVVVNATAFHNVPVCESSELEAFRINAVAPRHLGMICTELGARLVHVSTDYVFDGRKRSPYAETDSPNPLNVYGVSKLAGEHMLLGVGGDHQIVRTSGLYGIRPCRAKGGNFIDTMFRAARDRDEVRVVDDEVLTPTYTADLAAQIRRLSLAGPPGIYHATNQGSCSWYEFARQIFDIAGLRVPLVPTSVEEFTSPVRRPLYSVLANAALASRGLDQMRHWRDALEDYMSRRLATAESNRREAPSPIGQRCSKT